ncbi:putative ankyrin repeat-containing domain, PGG domain, protein accelerated cell death 6 [Rosa chinensis]|uniref:Putative ankyrin repeat-containing domain, PGG domain, protein accelerated cell death 6 n=1 Tax=Rosa chinensis TaxID=74649 RepID=A0A2P6QCP2_ROSCH|nr:protein ACCELERATED CELL DEATH 6 [Rosa chinensis]PRQ31955.1 putative ankyrin repeat-containing domain, PGG domain, protein accelerated cell death 6 [Rosa chinensis]
MHQNQIQDSHLTDHSKLYHQLYRYASEGRQTDFITAIQKVANCDQNASIQLLSRLSPLNNSFLHTAVTFGHVSLAIKIMKLHPPLLLVKNFEGDTALHVAAKTGGGDDNLIRCIMEHENLDSGEGQATDIEKVDISVFRMKNDEENTPLHEALINGNHLEAKYLIKADPSVSFCANEERKSPLYLAAEAGLVEIVKLIYDTTAVQNNTGDQGNGVPPMNLVMEGKSPLHAAILSQKEDVLGILSRMRFTVEHLEDEKGRTPLHCAASTGYLEGLRFLLKRCLSDSHRADSGGTFPIHSASSKGHVPIVKLLLEHYPDLKELRNSSGENILHVAAKCGRDNLVKYFLEKGEFKMLINQKNKAGNTPLHLATIYQHPAVVNILTWDKRTNLKLLNVRGMTALDIAENTLETTPSFHRRLAWIALKSAGAQQAQSSNIWKTGQNTQQDLLVSATKPLGGNGGDVRTKIEDATDRVINSCNNIQLVLPNKQSNKDTVNTLLVVTTLIATVSFAAGFTMPGGYNNSGPHEGTATLLNKEMFQVFVICNTLAMYNSVLVAITLIWAQLGDLSLVPLRIALPLLGLALTMLSLAFMAGVFVVVSSLQWLASVVMIMGVVFLFTVIALFTPLFFPSKLFPTSSTFRVRRYIIYYPFRLAVLVSGSHKDFEEED